MNAAQQRALLLVYALVAAIIAITLAIVVIVFLIIDAATLAAGASSVGDIPLTLEPCATEDSTGCYWDADAMGNGRGNDLVTLAP